MASMKREFCYQGSKRIKVLKWKVKPGSRLSQGTVVLLYENFPNLENETGWVAQKVKSSLSGTVLELVAKEGDILLPGTVLLYLQACTHPTVMKDLCAECGADLRQLDSEKLARVVAATSVSMVHSVPELRVSHEQAQQLGQADEQRLLINRKLVLLVDLDQTLIHTTNDSVPPNLKDVYHFQLYGPRSPWYHTRLRPGTQQFLNAISKLYELHICTFGARPYAHMIAHLLDPDGKFFSHRILSRDECFNPTSKTGNLKALFPCGDSMVCIIDDREDVWNFAPNLVPVKPYHFFRNTGDINAPPGLSKTSDTYLFPQVPSKKLSDGKELDSEMNESHIDDMPCSEENKNNQSSVVNSTSEDGANSCVESAEDTMPGSISSSVKNEDTEISIYKDENHLNKSESAVEIKEAVSSTCEEVASENAISSSDSTNFSQNEINSSCEKSSSEITKNDADTSSDIESKDKDSDDIIDVQDDDDYLLYLEEILSNIHKAFYDMFDQIKVQGNNTIPDLKNVIPYVRRKVLKGTNIVFSGVIPTNMPPEKNRLWLCAKALGANICLDLVPQNKQNDSTTHVIATKWGTAKVNRAKKMKGVHVVTPDWLLCSAERWEQAEERLFLLSKDSNFKLPSHANSVPMEQRHGEGKHLTQVHETVATHKEHVCPVYDPVTGKRIRSAGAAQNTTISEKNPSKKSKPQTKFSDSYSPLLAFSSQEITEMGREVDDACSEESDIEDMNKPGTESELESDLENGNIAKHSGKKRKASDTESSSAESLGGGECPRGWKKRSRKCLPQGDRINDEFGGLYDSDNDIENMRFPRRELPKDSDKSDDSQSISDEFNESIGSVDEEMAAAVEREFLS